MHGGLGGAHATHQNSDGDLLVEKAVDYVPLPIREPVDPETQTVNQPGIETLGWFPRHALQHVGVDR